MSEGHHYCRRFALNSIFSDLQTGRDTGDISRRQTSTISTEETFEFIFRVVEIIQTDRSKAEQQ
jgi:hypothetical protein